MNGVTLFVNLFWFIKKKYVLIHIYTLHTCLSFKGTTETINSEGTGDIQAERILIQRISMAFEEGTLPV